MKPLRIVMINFGPYADEQVIDFTLLGDNSLFLIHGPTGAGKSSILDAVCFALYGDPSGNERNSKDMRSGFSDPFEPTEVIFDFMLRDKVYRVYRSLEYEKPGKKEGEKTTVPAKANLWERTGIDEINNDGAVIASKCRSVTEKIEILLGFRIDQFRQVVILPQGEFRKFLLATSTDKGNILELLFNTEFYRRVQDALKGEASSIEKLVEILKEQRKTLLNHYSVETDEEIKDISVGVYKELLESDGKVLQLNEEEKIIRKELEKAQEIQNKFNERTEAEKPFKKLEAKNDEIKKLEEKLLKGRKTLPLQALEKVLTEKEEDYEKSEHRLKTAVKEVKEAEELLNKAIEILGLEKEKEKERDELISEIGRLKAFPGKVKILEDAGTKVGIIKEEIGVKEGLIEKEKSIIEKVNSDLGNCKKELLTLKEKSSGIETAGLKLKEAERNLNIIKEILETEPEKTDYKTSYEKEKIKSEKLETEREEKRKKKEELEHAWITGQASVIASKLIPGAPCPVCGSVEHPSPAVMTGSVPSEDSFKKAIKDFKNIEEKCKKSREDMNEFYNKYQAISISLGEKRNFLGELKVKTPEFFQEEFSLALKEKQVREKAKETGLKMEKTIVDMENKRSQSGENLEKLMKELSEKRERKVEEEKIVQLMEKDIPEDLRNVKKLEEKILRKGKDLRKLRENLEKAVKNHSQSAAFLEARKEALKNAGNYNEEAMKKYTKTKNDFEEKLLSEGFSDKEDYISCWLSSEDINRIDGETQNYKKEFHSAQERYRRALKETDGLEKPEIYKIQCNLERIKTELKQYGEEIGKMKEKVASLGNAIDKLKEISEEKGKLEKKYSIIGRISEVACGKNFLRITFQRYVLASLLDDIIIAANQRLILMSNKRYSLRRAVEKKDQRRSGGLDLLVDDEYTGMARPVSTLSGGESFLASLSLALGLADVVQAYAGGIRLDTIFVDEGFGSLDPEALDLAFRALIDLQKSGRLVGVISHVPELRERISTRLEVTSTRKGSKARFVV